MKKWEYLRLWATTAISTSVYLAPPDKIEQHKLTQQLSVEVEPRVVRIGRASVDALEVVIPKGKSFSNVYYSLLDYLGTGGWEPFATSDTDGEIMHHFKRCKE